MKNSKLNIEHILHLMTKAALAAGSEILKVYELPICVEEKQDGTPVTFADQRAETIILEHLRPTGLPILAEESVEQGNIPELGARYFVVDPLDGTKEFIKKNDEFTVNIALVENGHPLCGIVTAPALNVGYIGSELGAFSFPINNGKAGPFTPIRVRGTGPVDIVSSRSHGDNLLEQLQGKLGATKNSRVGSSLKFCLLATGAARLYPRFTPTCEWDIAAGQAVLEAAGGVLLTTKSCTLEYGKACDEFLNPFFVAADDRGLALKTARLMAEIL